MAVRNNLAIIMAKNRKFSIEEIANDTGLSRNTISTFKHDKAKGIQYQTLEVLCKYFNVPISEMLTLENEAS